MNKNEAESVIRDTIEYANREIMKTKQKYRRRSLAVLFAVIAVIAALCLIYTRPRTLQQRYPYLDFSQCTEIKGYYFIAPDDDRQFDILSADGHFQELSSLIQTTGLKTRLGNILPQGTKIHAYTDGEYKWDITLCFEDITLPDGSCVSGNFLHIGNFFGDLSFSMNGETVRCSAAEQEQWTRAILDIITQYTVE